MATPQPVAAASAPGVNVRSVPGLGRCAIALRPFARAEHVLREAPLLYAPCIKPADPALAGRVEECAKALPQTPRSAFYLLAFAGASAEVRARVLSSFFHFADSEATPVACGPGLEPPLECAFRPPRTPHEEQLSKLCHQAASVCRAKMPAELGAVSEPVLARAAMIFALNGHAYQSGTGLFELGSKVNHSCVPNVKYHTSLALAEDDATDGKTGGGGGGAALGPGVYVALRDIAPGEMLTFDYLTGSLSLMPTTSRRRWLLLTKTFACECARCSRMPDVCRGLPCPACAAAGDGVERRPDGMLPADPLASRPQPLWPAPKAAVAGQRPVSARHKGVGNAGSAPPYLYCDMALKEANATQPWACARCGLKVVDSEAAILGGPDVLAKLMAHPAVATLLAERHAPGGPGPAESLERALDDATRRFDMALGTKHADLRWERVANLYAATAGALGPEHGATKRAQRLVVEVAQFLLRALLAGPVTEAAQAPGGRKSRDKAVAEAAASVAETVHVVLLHLEDLWAWVGRITHNEALFAGFNCIVPLAGGCGACLLEAARCPALPPALRGRCAALARDVLAHRALPVWAGELGPDAPVISTLHQQIGACAAAEQAAREAAASGSIDESLLALRADLLTGLSVEPYPRSSGPRPPPPPPPGEAAATGTALPPAARAAASAAPQPSAAPPPVAPPAPVAAYGPEPEHTTELRPADTATGAPAALLVRVAMPAGAAAADAELLVDAAERVLVLTLPAPKAAALSNLPAQLRLALPFEPDEGSVRAKLDKKTCRLTVTVPQAA